MDWYTFYQRYRQDDNEWWRLSEGDMQNLFEDAADAAVGFEKTATEQYARAEAAEAALASCNRARQAAEAEIERLREQVAQLTAERDEYAMAHEIGPCGHVLAFVETPAGEEPRCAYCHLLAQVTALAQELNELRDQTFDW